MDDRASREETVSMEEIEAEDAVSLPNKEVLSLLDVNANVDLGLDLAAPVDLAVAANLNVAAPIEASAAANVLSPDATAMGVAEQQGHLDQTLSGAATATAPQHAGVAQDSSGGTSPTAPATGAPATSGGTAATDGAAPTAGSTAADPAATAGGTTGTGDAVSGVVSNTTGGVDSLLNGGSLLDANINVDATANLAAPIDGAVAANANVAAPVDAAVGANIASPGAAAEALAPQNLDIQQNLDNVSAGATATQDANVSQQ